MKEALENNIKAVIVDRNNEIQLIKKKKIIKKDNKYKYISIIPLTTEVTGVTLKGMKYSLNNYNLKIGSSLGISNEQIEENAEIELSSGILIIIKSRD